MSTNSLGTSVALTVGRVTLLAWDRIVDSVSCGGKTPEDATTADPGW